MILNPTGSGGITNSAGNNVVPKSNGTNLVASGITDNGTTVATTEKIQVGTPTSSYSSEVVIKPSAVNRSGLVIEENGQNFSVPIFSVTTAAGVEQVSIYSHVSGAPLLYMPVGGGWTHHGFFVFDGVGSTPQISVSGDSGLSMRLGKSIGWSTNGDGVNVFGGMFIGNDPGNDGLTPTVWYDQWMQSQESDGSGVTNMGPQGLAADQTKTNTAFANIPAFTMQVAAGQIYAGKIFIKCNNTVATEGIKFDFNGGTATMTSFWAAASETVGGTTVLGTAISTSLAGVINYTTITGETLIELTFSFKVNVKGTVVLRFAENSTAAGTATVELGSFMVPNNIAVV